MIMNSVDIRASITARLFTTYCKKDDFCVKRFSTLLYNAKLVLPTVYAATVEGKSEVKSEASTDQKVDAKSDQTLNPKDSRRDRIREALKNETKFDRLCRMYSLNEFGVLSPELRSVLNTGYATFFIGGILRMLMSAHKSKEDFERRNAATAFESEYLYRRHLNDKMILTGVRYGVIQGFKMAFCSTAYLLVALTVATYNNKVTIFEHFGAGVVMGALYRINFGLKGMAAAGLLGGVLGSISGSIMLLGMKLSGVTFEEYRYMTHEMFAPEIQQSMRVKDEIKRLENP